MMESSFLVEAMVRGYHVYKDSFQNFQPGSFFQFPSWISVNFIFLSPKLTSKGEG